MVTRVAAIGVSHWHSIYDSAYLRHLNDMDDVDLVGLQDVDPSIAAHRAKELGGDVPTFSDYRQMLREVKPDFVLALGSHDTMSETAHCLLDSGISFIMEKPMSFNARQLQGVVQKADATGGPRLGIDRRRNRCGHREQAPRARFPGSHVEHLLAPVPGQGRSGGRGDRRGARLTRC